MKCNFIHAEHIQHTFDCFCKKVIKNEAINLQKNEQRKKERFVPFSEVGEDVHYVMDEYIVDYDTFEVFGHCVEIKHHDIAMALEKLQELRRSIILLSYFVGLNDREISILLKVSRSRVQYNRAKGLEELAERLKK